MAELDRRDFIRAGGMASIGLALGVPGSSLADAGEIIARHREGGEYIEIDGLKIFYRRGGPQGGVPVVMTHGIPRSSFLYRRMIPILSERHRVLAWDLYGFGLSDKPTDQAMYNFSEYEIFFGKFLDALGIERAHLVCHDVGGPFTIAWAVHNPDRVASLTILNTTVFLKGFHIPGPVFALIATPMGLQRLALPDERYGDYILRYLQNKALYNPEALAGAEGEAFKELLMRDGGRWSVTRVAKGYLKGDAFISKELSSFKRPTLVLWGRHDPFCTLPIAHTFKGHIPHAELHIVDQASHFLQEDRPEEVSEVILDFIKPLG